jgi:hypothetical protein
VSRGMGVVYKRKTPHIFRYAIDSDRNACLAACGHKWSLSVQPCCAILSKAPPTRLVRLPLCGRKIPG